MAGEITEAVSRTATNWSPLLFYLDKVLNPARTLYVGVTSDLIKRIYEHKNDLVEGFTQKYTIHNLVYFEATESIESAIMREKQLKKWNRVWKIHLIEKNNPAWNDLYPDLI